MQFIIIIYTLVIGASNGNPCSFARLARLNPSDPTDLTSKDPRRTECKEPRAISQLTPPGPVGSDTKT